MWARHLGAHGGRDGTGMVQSGKYWARRAVGAGVALGTKWGMPRKLRELRRDLRRVGYRVVRQKGSHEQWAHPLVPTPLTLDGRDGEDADHYQERAVQRYIRLAEAERRQQP
jgi:predicted RNA binding protein YcfA (HicA-like mRNA interferase family)